MDAAVEDAGNGFQFHTAAGLGRHADAVFTALRAASLWNSDDRSSRAPARDSRHGRPAALTVRGGHPPAALGVADNGPGMRRQQRIRVGRDDGTDVQRSFGLVSCSEWTGVLL